MKYNVVFKFEVDGIVDKPDIIGAIFGQTENLFGEEFDLRELQDKGRLGRITVELRRRDNRTEGEVVIPSNLDRVETALIASMIENVDKAGPYNIKFQLVEIQDIRAEKLKKIIDRAKEILSTWSKEKTLDIREVLNEVTSSVRTGEIIEYGPEKLPAGPNVDKDPNLIIVEGRADVINLLRYGYKNTLGIEGATGRIPESAIRLSKQKKMVIAFLDGDHGGDLILKQLINSDARIDYVARAPQGREVEELTGKEIAKALSNMMPLGQYLKRQEAKAEVREARTATLAQTVQPQEVVVQEQRPEEVITMPNTVLEEVKKLPGTLEGIIFDESWNPVEKVQVRDIIPKLENGGSNNATYIIFDGVITQRLLELASERNIKLLVGARVGGLTKRPKNVKILTFTDMLT
ncbi:DNA primase DnaG [Sulfodiicoccus acidiphilus]|uniref:DNA primase DnaG n=1 Tax=Sulfodiicoccus acidiphilus TaxID=1670455 RepID=UPI000F82E112|nr:DNA primase DnaG [Sulfodiicoccus acidiphilus]